MSRAGMGEDLQPIKVNLIPIVNALNDGKRCCNKLITEAYDGLISIERMVI